MDCALFYAIGGVFGEVGADGGIVRYRFFWWGWGWGGIIAGVDAFLLDNVLWVAVALGAGGGLVWTFVRAGRISLTPQAATLLVTRGGGVFLDVRPAAEYGTGHIPRSQNVPESELATRKAAVEKFKNKPVVVVCANGMRARKVAQQLVRDGFAQAHVLAGGVAGWRDANLPLFNKPKDGKRRGRAA